MKKRWIALALALAMGLTMGAGAALAEGTESSARTAVLAAADAALESARGTDEESAAESGEPSDEAPLAVSVQAEAESAAEQPTEPDAEGTLSLQNLESRMRENYYPMLVLEERVKSVDEIDYDKLERDLRNQMSGMANAQMYLAMTGGFTSMLDSTVSALRDQYDDLKKGKLQRTNEGLRRQFCNLQDQTVLSAEALYINIVTLREQDAAMKRQLAAMDRGIAASEVSYSRGLISALALQQAKNGRTQLSSGLETLRMNSESLLRQLKIMAGVELDEPLSLAALPKVTEEQIAAMDLEADLARAREASYTLFDAKTTLDNAEEDYKKTLKDYAGGGYEDERRDAKRSWQITQYNYNSTQQGFELSFRNLYAVVKDDAQKCRAAENALAVETKNYQVANLKYQQQTISKNDLADASDALAAAKDVVSEAERGLLSDYLRYQWAVERGVLNVQ